jgi:hypothetical protein
MRIKVTVPVEIDVDAWCDEYGCDRSDVRTDVAEHIKQMVWQQLDAVGVGR